ncbi:cyclase family protein [Alicyclobacillus tolerans]|uniref:cyclase family protein n=1 Tax=Alicyclobacillus tolerans TaxID=90970 RepID=UPI001F1FA9DF|nr:cyclase family protein [Alicyclobacillus tolerans]MCF8564017.1 cyclase family protein [Alicyclobacillus tolerans]
MTAFYDISMAIHESMPVYKNKAEKKPSFAVTSDFAQGASARESRICLDVHTGTHVDAPLHMIPQGKPIDTISLEQLVTECRVLDLTQVTGGIAAQHLEAHDIGSGEFLLFKTRNSSVDGFDPEFVYLSESGAEFLVRQQVRGVGIDALGIERAQPEHPTHKLLFQANAVIIEGLRLLHVPPGRYRLIAAPLPLKGLDAAPARVFLTSLS